jgi:glycosyltransferase involved in cell wall biosynthesis
MSKKKILHLITGLEYGGTEMMLLKTLPSLREDFDMQVCCIRGQGPIGEKLIALGIPVTYLDLKSPFDWAVIGRFQTVVRDFHPDLLVTYLIHADLFGRVFGRIFGIKQIFCSVRVKLIQPKYLPLLMLDGLTSFFVDHYHFNSESVASMYRKYFFLPEKKITVIPNGLDLNRFTPDSRSRQTTRTSLGLEDALVIGCNARLEKQKGHTYLIEAFARLSHSYPKAKMILINDGQEKENLLKLVQNLGITSQVLFLGRRDDVPELLNAMDIFAFPTLFEGMANALMEAMASGLPIVATDIPENKELLVHDVSGILVPTRNSQAICIALEQLIIHTEKATSLGQNARKIALQRFDLTQVVARYRAFYSL